MNLYNVFQNFHFFLNILFHFDPIVFYDGEEEVIEDAFVEVDGFLEEGEIKENIGVVFEKSLRF